MLLALSTIIVEYINRSGNTPVEIEELADLPEAAESRLNQSVRVQSTVSLAEFSPQSAARCSLPNLLNW